MRPRNTSTDRSASDADDVRAYLDLTRLLDDVGVHHPELSAPLRLTLLRAHREHAISWLDQDRFRTVLDDLISHDAARSA